MRAGKGHGQHRLESGHYIIACSKGEPVGNVDILGVRWNNRGGKTKPGSFRETLLQACYRAKFARKGNLANRDHCRSNREL
jgi:hypothetical protein